jgi:hypothetical protein
MADFSGYWKLEKCENLDAFLKAKGLGMMKRRLAGQISITQVIEHKDDNISISTKTPGGTTESKMVVGGAAIKSETPAGEKITVESTWGNSAKTELCATITENGKVTKVTRKIKDGKLATVMAYEGVTCTRYFKKV